MSIIVHRCTVCGHIDLYHRAHDCSYTWCDAGPHTPVYDPDSFESPTFDIHGQPVARVVDPGSKFLGVDMCQCDACVTLHLELTA